MPALLAKVTRMHGAAAAIEAARVMIVLAVETSAQQATMVWDSTALHVKDAKDWATLTEREALERVSRVETENTEALASSHEDAESFVQKIALLED
jgi:hypothetical protein